MIEPDAKRLILVFELVEIRLKVERSQPLTRMLLKESDFSTVQIPLLQCSIAPIMSRLVELPVLAKEKLILAAWVLQFCDSKFVDKPPVSFIPWFGEMLSAKIRIEPVCQTVSQSAQKAKSDRTCLVGRQPNRFCRYLTASE